MNTSRPQAARQIVLERIRAALGTTVGGEPQQPPRAYRRAGTHPAGSEPVLELFASRLSDYRAAVHRAPETRAAETIATAIPPGARLIVPAGLHPDWVPAGAVTDSQHTTADLAAFDGVVTGCTVAAAETGTIALDGSPDQGRRALSLLPDLHVCIVRTDQVVQTVPELLARLEPTRPITLISGPSATSDIELERVEGVHGPRTLVVVLLDEHFRAS